MSTGKVLAALPVRTIAIRNSFQEKIKQNIAVVDNPGQESGKTTLRNALNGLQPSTTAASSNSLGIPLKNDFIIQIVNGRLKAR